MNYLDLSFDRQQFTDAYVAKFNTQLKHQLAAWDISDISQAFIREVPRQRAAQLSSCLSVLGELASEAAGVAVGLNWKHSGGQEYDSILQGIKVEHKFSANENNSWSGHPYSNKVPWHLLTRVLIEGDKVSRCFIGFVDTSTLTTAWSGSNSGTSSFASLCIQNQDIHKMIAINGYLQQTTGKKAKFTKVILK